MRPVAMCLYLCLLLPVCVRCLWHTTFCVVTASRAVSYVDETVRSFVAQRVLGHDGAALVVVDADGVMRGAPFTVRLADRERAPCPGPSVEGLPSCTVRQMTLDVTAALSQCANQTTGWVVLAEDDCVACEGAVAEVIHTLARLSARDIAMAKFSKFSRSTAIPVSKVHAFVRYARSRLYTHPYDITRVEEWDSGGVYTHDRNLFHHIGTVSTEATRNAQSFMDAHGAFRSDFCYESLT